MCQTGVGATLASSDADLKFTAGLYKIRSMSGLVRSRGVIDNSHLGQTAGTLKLMCFEDLDNITPLSVDIQQDFDNTTVFPTSDTSDGSVPIKLGEVTTASSEFVLTLPSTSGNATDLTFSGAWVNDGGINLVNNDRVRAVYQAQPDGTTFTWNGNT